jgi:inhibitor of cysteine peptidase
MQRRRGWRIVTSLVAVVGLGLVVAGCGGDDAGGGKSSGGSREHSAATPVFEAGDSITVQNGSTFVVELEANPTTGYAWTAEPNPDATFVSSEQVTSSTLPGAPGMQRLTFRATSTGSSTLVLGYARSFELVPPVETESFPLTVQ